MDATTASSAKEGVFFAEGFRFSRRFFVFLLLFFLFLRHVAAESTFVACFVLFHVVIFFSCFLSFCFVFFFFLSLFCVLRLFFPVWFLCSLRCFCCTVYIPLVRASAASLVHLDIYILRQLGGEPTRVFRRSGGRKTPPVCDSKSPPLMIGRGSIHASPARPTGVLCFLRGITFKDRGWCAVCAFVCACVFFFRSRFCFRIFYFIFAPRFSCSRNCRCCK